MAPQQKETPSTLVESSGGDNESSGEVKKAVEWEELHNVDPLWKWEETRWGFVALLVYLHLEAARGLYFLLISGQSSLSHFAFIMVYGYCGGLGVVAGSHRLWSHRSYKAKLPLRVLLVVMQTISGQSSVFRWTLDHRQHHKFSETNADPHNAKRGFFYSHVGWLLIPPHPLVTKKIPTIDLSDLLKDPVVMFQHRHYALLVSVLCFVFPTWVGWYVFGVDVWVAWSVNLVRYVININVVFCINSWAHMFGNRPYDKTIGPTQSWALSLLSCGEGWHNYHHAFSFDYRAAEWGFYRYNLCTGFIDWFAWVGWAYDLKTVPQHVVLDRVRRTGDGSHHVGEYH